MTIEPAERMNHIGQETAFEVLVRAGPGGAGSVGGPSRNGEPDFDTPSHIIAAAQDALERATRTTGQARGSLSSDKRSPGNLKRWRGLDIDPARWW